MIVIVNDDGNDSEPMPEHLAKPILQKLLGVSGGSQITNLSQALNDATLGRGKATSTYRFRNQAVLHASAGKAAVSSVTLFFYRQGGHEYIFAMGSHKNANTYVLDGYGQNGDAFFKPGAKLRL